MGAGGSLTPEQAALLPQVVMSLLMPSLQAAMIRHLRNGSFPNGSFPSVVQRTANAPLAIQYAH